MPLAPEMVYNDLNGEEIREILLTRFADLLNGVPEFKRHLTLNRVRMSLTVHLEVFGRTPPNFDLRDDLTVRTRETPEILPGSGQRIVAQSHDLSAEINSDSANGGQPPDQVREEHGIAVPTVQKGPIGYEDQPIRRPEAVKYASFVTQDYGPMRTRTGNEEPVGGGVISMKNPQKSRPDVPPDFSKFDKPGSGE